MRFPNEYDAVKERQGITIRVTRKWMTQQESKGQVLHPSETSLDNHSFDYEIDNSGTMEDLIQKVRSILQSWQLIG